MALTTSAATIRDARAVSGPAKGILEIGQGAIERAPAVRPRNRLILLHVTYNVVHTLAYAQTNSEYEICRLSDCVVILVCHPEARAFCATKDLCNWPAARRCRQVA